MALMEKANLFYRFLFSRIFTEDTHGMIFTKNWIYKIALFFAKKKGLILFFFSENEKKFEAMEIDEQYQVFLKNCTHDLESFKKTNGDLPIIDLVLHQDSSENVHKMLQSISQYNNFNLHIISTKNNFDHIESILNNLKLTRYKIIKKDKNDKIQKIFNNIISTSQSDFILFLDSMDGKLYDESLYHITRFCKINCDVIYFDDDFIDKNNQRRKPFFKPGWSPQLLWSYNYIGNFVIYSTSLLKSINGFDETVTGYEYDLLLRATKKSKKIIHVPIILFSRFETSNKNDRINHDKTCLQNFLKKNQILADITVNQEKFFSIKPKFDSYPLVSIIIPTKNKENLLSKCIKSIQKSTYKNYEIVIINNGNKIKSSFKNCKILDYNYKFNFSKLNNFAVKHANGDYFLFLNDDTEIINEDWLEYMLFYSMQRNVGVVGSLLLFPKSKLYLDAIQHAGVTLGTAGPAIHSFCYAHYTKQNNLNFDKISRNVSTVTAACMMIRKDVFDEVNGFDEKFIVAFGDTDICLRIKEKGYQTVYCSDSKLYHAESATRGRLHPLADEIEFLNRWEDYIISGDEFYNPNLTHINRNFRIAPHPSEIPAISLLKEIFYFRDDLKKEIPDYDKNIDDIIDWAAIKGVTADIARTALIPYNKFYLNNSSEKIKEVAEIIYKFNHSVELQKKFLEVFSGRYDKLLSYLQTE